MKRFLTILLSLVFMLSLCLSFTGCKDEESEEANTNKEITVFSWEDYIDLGDDEILGRENILDTFEEQTGIHVNYITFANSEEMYNELEKNPNACDLLCPSEYMIMKMMTEGKLRSFVTPENYKTNCSQYIKDVFKKIGIKDSDGVLTTPILTDDEETTYAVGYMWGTMGFVYNTDDYKEDELNNWLVANEDRFFDKVTIKDSVRDTYILAVGSVYNDELKTLKIQYDNGSIGESEYNEKITEIFNRCDEETVNKVEEYLIDLRDNLYYFEVDNAKTDILKGKIDLYFAWSGDAVYAMDSGDELNEPVTLGYVIPEEGSNIWFDGFVMPKSVSDSQAELAVKFLNFVSTPEIAIRNMEYIGYVSVISGDAEEPFTLYYDETEESGCEYSGILDWVKQNYCVESTDDEGFMEEVDLSYFFGDGAVVYSTDHGRQLFGLYSDTETIKRCAIMDNFSDEALDRVNEMWSNVKFIQLSTTAIVLIIVFIVLLVALLIIFKHYGSEIIYLINAKIIYRDKKRDTIIKVERQK